MSLQNEDGPGPEARGHRQEVLRSRGGRLLSPRYFQARIAGARAVVTVARLFAPDVALPGTGTMKSGRKPVAPITKPLNSPRATPEAKLAAPTSMTYSPGGSGVSNGCVLEETGDGAVAER